ncbi:Peptidyl-prolyl cis-trans isomerase fpr2 [Geranomyces michiganensis]|nr:Peptidyl-prolyl cis-trans isomerase fpr2 [Geranomyces michiganensis]
MQLILRLPLLVVVVALLALTGSVLGDKPKRAPPTQLQIGVKHRVPEAECTRKSKIGDTLSMHYTGTLFSTGEKFDSSLDRNQPFEFTVGQGQVIKGWDTGLLDMCVGEKRKLVIPSHLGYGDRGSGAKIPGGSTLVFETELLAIKNRENGEL